MAQIFDQNRSTDNTIRIFDSFYNFDLIIGSDQFDIVNGYFLSVCGSKDIAGNFTAFLFKISQEADIPVLTLLEYIQGKNNLEMNQFISYYMNSFKSKTSLYGVSYLPHPNQTVQRNILQ
jgi:hypothetical protein